MTKFIVAVLVSFGLFYVVQAETQGDAKHIHMRQKRYLGDDSRENGLDLYIFLDDTPGAHLDLGLRLLREIILELNVSTSQEYGPGTRYQIWTWRHQLCQVVSFHDHTVNTKEDLLERIDEAFEWKRCASDRGMDMSHFLKQLEIELKTEFYTQKIYGITHRKSMILILTDGKDFTGYDPKYRIEKLHRFTQTHETKIMAIKMTNECSTKGRDVLENLVSTDGLFYFLDNDVHLWKILGDLLNITNGRGSQRAQYPADTPTCRPNIGRPEYTSLDYISRHGVLDLYIAIDNSAIISDYSFQLGILFIKSIISQLTISKRRSTPGTHYKLWTFNYDTQLIFDSDFDYDKNDLLDLLDSNVSQRSTVEGCDITWMLEAIHDDIDFVDISRNQDKTRQIRVIILTHGASYVGLDPWEMADILKGITNNKIIGVKLHSEEDAIDVGVMAKIVSPNKENKKVFYLLDNEYHLRKLLLDILYGGN